MSWIAVMVGAGVGATAGGVSAGLNGGDAGDILKSMAIGGAMGGAGGGIGGAVFGGAGGAAAGAGGGAAAGGTTGATTGALTGSTTGALTGSTTGTLGAAGNAALASALPTSVGTVGGTVGGTAGGTVGGTVGGTAGGATGGAGFAGLNGGTGLLAGGTGGAGGGAGAGGVSSGGISSLPGQSGFVGPQATQGQIANASAYTDANMGTRFLADLTNNQGNIVGNTGLKMAGGALQGGVMNAGINGLVAGAQGQDVGEAMGKGALTGAVGGAAGAGLASMAGSGGTLGSIGNFAAKHDVLVPAALSMGSGMALDSALASDPTMPEQKGIRSNYKWNPNVYRPYGPQFAAGGITDLDNYDQAPQMQNPGTLDIPNRNEVSNNQGYMGDSVQLMAHGGVTEESFMLEGVGGKNLHREASQDLREFLEGTPDSELTTAQQRQKQILFAKKMAMGGAAYNHGGISDLGGYSDGGRLLKGPGDGVSDDIPASIGGKQPARLAEGEFVVPARIVSELGNGSTDAGAKRLYQMMDRIQSDRKKTTGKGKFSDNPKAYKHLPA